MRSWRTESHAVNEHQPTAWRSEEARRRFEAVGVSEVPPTSAKATAGRDEALRRYGPNANHDVVQRQRIDHIKAIAISDLEPMRGN